MSCLVEEVVLMCSGCCDGGGVWVFVYCVAGEYVYMEVCGRGVCVRVCVARKGLLRV